MMHLAAAVVAVFPLFTDKLEGHCDCMYLDRRGLVTTGRGNLYDPWPMVSARRDPWTIDGVLASPMQVSTEWHEVKARQDLVTASYPTRRAITRLRLSEEAIDALTVERLTENANIIAGRIRGWDGLPPDVQLAVMSIAWACGAEVQFPHMFAAIEAGDYATAAAESEMAHIEWTFANGMKALATSEAAARAKAGVQVGIALDKQEDVNPGLTPRNAINKSLLLSAATDPTELHWPSVEGST